MATQSFAALKLKVPTTTKSFEVAEGKTIEVSQYLPTADKFDLIEATLQKSSAGDIYNPTLLDAYFHLHLVYLYSNLTFTTKQKEDELKLYDILQSNGVIEKIVAEIPKEEYDRLYEYLNDAADAYERINGTAFAAIREIINRLPEGMQRASEIVDGFDPSKYQAVIDFAQAANGGRDINTNQPVE